MNPNEGLDFEEDASFDDDLLFDLGGPELKLIDAKLEKRLLNYVIDYVFIVMIVTVLMLISTLIFGTDIENLFFQYFLAFLAMLIYYTMEYFANGKTIGKIITGTRVVTELGQAPTIEDVLKRTLCRMIPFEPFSFFGRQAKGWHDTISKTIVVDEKLSSLED